MISERSRPVWRANSLNVISACTRSRSIERPSEVSPSNNALIASAYSARANLGSCLIRAITVSLYSRVSAIFRLYLLRATQLQNTRPLKPKDILHVVQSGFLTDDPLSGAEGAVSEGVAAGGFVSQFEAL